MYFKGSKWLVETWIIDPFCLDYVYPKHNAPPILSRGNAGAAGCYCCCCYNFSPNTHLIYYISYLLYVCSFHLTAQCEIGYGENSKSVLLYMNTLNIKRIFWEFNINKTFIFEVYRIE